MLECPPQETAEEVLSILMFRTAQDSRTECEASGGIYIVPLVLPVLNRDRLSAGDIDDVFASDSEDEGQQQQRDTGHISEAEEEEDEFEALFQGSKKKKRGQGRTHEVGFS